MPSRVVVDDDEQIIADLLKQQRTLQGRQATTSVRGTHDGFVVSATPETTFQLTYIPVDGTCAMYVNGLEQTEGSAYTVDYDTTSGTVGEVTFVTSLTTGDQIDFRYLVTDWLVARSLAPEGDLVAPGTFDSELGGTDAGASGDISRSYTSVHDCLLLLWVGWATATNDSTPSSISDSNGLTWTKLAESIQNNAGNPSTVALVCYGLDVGSTPITGTVTVTVPAHATFDVWPMQFANATFAGDVASGHAATAKGIAVGSLSLSLATSPAGNQSTLTGMVNWPHKTITEDAAYTEIIQANNPGGGGPYGQEFRFAYAYVLSGSTGNATLTNSAAADSAAVMVTVSPT